MSRLGKRVERLEGGPGDKATVWVWVPDNWSEAEQTAAAGELAQEHGIQPPFDVGLCCVAVVAATRSERP